MEVLANKNCMAGTVPANKNLMAGTVQANNSTICVPNLTMMASPIKGLLGKTGKKI